MAISNLITNKTKIIELNNNLYHPNLLSKKTRIKKDVCECWNNWYISGNKWFYFKDFSREKYNSFEFKLINELIGEYLANYLNIDVIHYEFAKLDNTLGLASESFIQKGSKYCFQKDINIPCNYANMQNIYLLRNRCKNDLNYHKLMNEIFKLLSIDIYMNQTDRSYSNCQFRIEKGNLHLAPLYDFEESFIEPFKMHYNSNLVGIEIDEIKKYDKLKEILVNLFNLDILDVLREIEFKRNICISKENKEYYREFVNDRKMLLKSVF